MLKNDEHRLTLTLREAVPMRLRYTLISVSMIVLLAVSTSRTAKAGGKAHQIQLSDLEGTTAETAQGSIVECTDSTGSPVACDTTGAIAHSFSYLSVGPVIRDDAGNACGSFTQTLANIPPDTTPPTFTQFQVGSKTKDYDPDTATGDCSFTSYIGASCSGATATGGTAIGAGTCHSTASQGGRRIDFILTTLSGVGAFSISGVDHRE